MNPATLLLLLTPVIQNGSHCSANFTTNQPGQSSNITTAYTTDDNPDFYDPNFQDSSNKNLLDSFIKEDWEDFVENVNVSSELRTSSEGINIKLYYGIYSRLYNLSSTCPNILEDFKLEASSLGQTSLQITAKLLKTSDKTGYFLTYEPFKEKFINSQQILANFEQLRLKATEMRREVLFEFIFMGLVALFVGVFGVIGNLLSILVLASPKIRSSFSVLLIGLAVSDIMVLLRELFFRSVRILVGYSPGSTEIRDDWWRNWKLEIIRKGMRSALYSSIFFTMAITLERYIVVCHPISSRIICTVRKSVVTVGTIFILSNLSNVPYLCRLSCKGKHQNYYPEGGNYSYEDCKGEAKSEDSKRYNANVIILEHFVMFLLPVATLLLFNALIYFRIRQVNETRNRLTNSSPTGTTTTTLKEYSLTHILFVIVLIFFLTNIPITIIEGLEEYILYQTPPPYLNEIKSLTLCLFYLQFSINFLIYFVYGKTFRTVFTQMFFGWRKKAVVSPNSQPGTSSSKVSSSNL